MFLLLLACAPNTQTVPTEARSCPAPRFESLGSWNNESLPTVIPPDGRDPGVGVGDLDGDGDEDFLYAWAGGTQIFLNDRGELAPGPELSIDGRAPTRSRAVALSDLDDDGDQDVILGHDVPAADELLWNDGTGLSYRSYQFPKSNDTTWTASLGDFNGDGKVDLYTATYAVPFDVNLITGGGVVGTGHAFWMQKGPEDWEKVPVPAEVDTAVSLQGAVIDADMDGQLDLYMVNDFGPYVLPNRLLHNNGGTFTVDAGCNCDLSMYTMGAGVGDSNGDGAPDLLLTDIGTPRLLLNEGDGSFFDASLTRLNVEPAPDRLTSWGSAFVDLDLDGDEDAVVAYGALGPNGSGVMGMIANTDPTWMDDDDQYSSVLLNDGSGNFSLLPTEDFPDLSRSRNVAVADLDGDTRPDLVVAGRKRIAAWRNVGGCEEGLVLELHGSPGNADAFGAKVEAEVDGEVATRWALPSTTGSQSTHKIFVGLHGQKQADRVVVTWPDGSETVLEDVAAGFLRVDWSAS